MTIEDITNGHSPFLSLIKNDLFIKREVSDDHIQVSQSFRQALIAIQEQGSRPELKVINNPQFSSSKKTQGE